MTSITDLDADTLSLAIHARQVSCREVMTSYLERIHRINPTFNAIVNLAADDVLIAMAEECDADLAHGLDRGWLHGIPQAIKDTGHAKGFPTTYGCALLKDDVAKQDSVMTARMKEAGCIVIGKTNMPEFGLGSHTFNDLFGTTGNAWDTRVSAGGSSGGAAVALAQRLLPVADGSDFMGSLRNPAGWNNIFGMRPSQGRVPFWPAGDVWVAQLGTEGPMARTVKDLAKLLAVQSGAVPQVPLSIAARLKPFVQPSDAIALKGKRIGWLGDLTGYLAIEDGILPVCEQALKRCADAGAVVEPIALGFDTEALWRAWLSWRRALVAPKVAALMSLPSARDKTKPEALWEYDQGMSMSFMDFMKASEVRTAFHTHLLGLFDRYDVLALPVAQVWPFAVEERWPKAVAGRAMDTYHRWMECTLYATFGGMPAISVPAGFHANGKWPMGLQLIGKPQGDAELLDMAAAYELTAAELLTRRPSHPMP
jgi:amidase